MAKIQTMLERARIEKGLTKAALARAAKMQQGTISWIESGRFIPYESQLSKLAEALDWQGKPEELIKEVQR